MKEKHTKRELVAFRTQTSAITLLNHRNQVIKSLFFIMLLDIQEILPDCLQGLLPQSVNRVKHEKKVKED